MQIDHMEMCVYTRSKSITDKIIRTTACRDCLLRCVHITPTSPCMANPMACPSVKPNRSNSQRSSDDQKLPPNSNEKTRSDIAIMQHKMHETFAKQNQHVQRPRFLKHDCLTHEPARACMIHPLPSSHARTSQETSSSAACIASRIAVIRAVSLADALKRAIAVLYSLMAALPGCMKDLR